MKKLTALLMGLILVLSLTACGSGDTEKKDKKDKKDQVEKNEKVDSEKTEENSVPSGEITFEELVVVDNDECSITITGIDPDDMWGYALQVELVNKSKEKSYMFSLNNAAVNGVQTTTLFASEVPAGKTDNNTINFMDDSSLEEHGIGTFTDIELAFEVSDSEDWSAEPVAQETVHVYPYGEDAAVAFERESQAEDNVLVDNDDITVIVTGYEIDEIWGYTVNLFLVNKTDKNLMFAADEESVNDKMATTLFATEVASKKCVFATMSWMEETLKESGIDNMEDIEKLEFKLSVSDSEDWLADAIFDEVITLEP